MSDDAGACRVLTIGHSTRPIDEFVGLLSAHGVTQLVDVRTVPRTRHNPQFNADALPDSLAAAGIGYVLAQPVVSRLCRLHARQRCHRSLISDALLVHGIASCEIASVRRLQPHRLTPFAKVQGSEITYPAAAP